MMTDSKYAEQNSVFLLAMVSNPHQASKEMSKTVRHAVTRMLLLRWQHTANGL